MSKILLFSDIHIFPHKGSLDRLNDCLNALQWVFDVARSRNIKHIVFGGDLFQERHKIQVYAYNKTFQILENNTDIELYLLLGNHDLWYHEKTDISGVYPLGALKNIQIINKPATIEVAGLPIDFIPFTFDPLSVIEKHFKKKSPIMVGHLAVDGAILNFHHKTKAEVSVEYENNMVSIDREVFTGWQRGFLGHYHGAQKLTGNVEYIGSTLQLTFGEAFQKKHVIILDTESLEIEYVENTISPKHLILKEDELDKYQLDGNFVRIYMDDISKSDIVERKRELTSTHPSSQITILQEDKKEEKIDDDKLNKFNLADGDIFERYIKAVGNNNLDFSKLLSWGKDICVESYSGK